VTRSVLRILSAGAAQSVAEQIAARLKSESGREVAASFGAVGAIKARVVAGEPADAIILTAALIDELIASGHVAPGTRRDLGTVGTGVAVRAGTRPPDVSGTEGLRGVLIASQRIVFPDPAIATAGKVVMRALDVLGIEAAVRPRARTFPNGYAAMSWLAQSGGASDLGITQTTEILANDGVTYAGPLPAELQMKTIYSAGVAADTRNSDAAREFIDRLTAPSARAMLQAAGYEFDR
jgi:molybdate transport system substrate-binding protein